MARDKVELFKWSANTVERELGIKRETFLRKCAQAQIAPTAGLYTSAQVVEAMFGDQESALVAENIKVKVEQSRRLNIANRKSLGELVDADQVFKAYEGVFVAIRQTILASNLTDAEKAEIFENLRHDIDDDRGPDSEQD